MSTTEYLHDLPKHDDNPAIIVVQVIVDSVANRKSARILQIDFTVQQFYSCFLDGIRCIDLQYRW